MRDFRGIKKIIWLSMAGIFLSSCALTPSKPSSQITHLYSVPQTYRSQAKEMRVVFLDVGQGDSAYIETPSGKNILIDGSGTPSWSDSKWDPGESVIVPYILNEREREKIDYVILTHPHGDHFGGLSAVLQSLKVKEYLDAGLSSEEFGYERLLKIVEKKKIPYSTIAEGDVLDWDPLLKIEVLNPPSEFLYEGTNDNSLVIKMTYNQVSFLFTGDVEKEAEIRLAQKYGSQLKTQVLKVGHHGSDTSSSSSFIRSVLPEVAVISVGQGNLFQHPRPETLSKLSSYGSRIYRTDLDGQVTIRTDGLRFTLETSK